MTNLLAIISVLIVTNVVEADNSRGCSGWWINHQTGDTSFAVYHPFHADCKPYVEPTEKTKTTTVTEIHTIKFQWRGKERTVSEGKVLSEKVEQWVKKENWVKQ